ncbi:hypothetical protein K505DRAFT_329385 [Melanomma pulvis-pyrius CBS 109.77]|uniref:Uncharacterized protein n=1 Tax=Melanomma pulvis-pyrius CBS 109.77 TaxID=1314802 RepID=A0A6A6WUS0_9PLEO|nr:hypothetical protein K505DRAFT_329385 [Melanomma pulvis-pyrius CBS 109.77]
MERASNTTAPPSVLCPRRISIRGRPLLSSPHLARRPRAHVPACAVAVATAAGVPGKTNEQAAALPQRSYGPPDLCAPFSRPHLMSSALPHVVDTPLAIARCLPRCSPRLPPSAHTHCSSTSTFLLCPSDCDAPLQHLHHQGADSASRLALALGRRLLGIINTVPCSTHPLPPPCYGTDSNPSWTCPTRFAAVHPPRTSPRSTS